jgi:hypothetical protein
MEPRDFIEIFEKTLEVNENYNSILNDLQNNVFPFHDRAEHISSRRYYYWLKQNNSLKFKKLNGVLKKLVKNKINEYVRSDSED